MSRFLVAGLLVSLSLSATAAEIGVRVRFGLTDSEAKVWNGTVSAVPGKVALISGWRFEQSDRANGTTGWTASTRGAADFRSNAQKAKAKAAQQKAGKGKKAGGAAAKARAKAGAGGMAMADNGVLLTLVDVNENSVVTVNTEQGDFTFKLSEIPYGTYISRLDGAVEVERTAAARQISSDQKVDDDYPSAAAGKDGTVYVTYTSYTPGIDRSERTTAWEQPPGDLSFLSKAPGGDQLFVRVVKNGVAGEPIAVTATGCDIYKSAVAVAGDGTAWIFWSQNKSFKPFPNNGVANFEIFGRPLKDGKLGEETNLSTSAESDIWPAAASDSAGHVWVAWQGARDRVFNIVARRQVGGGQWGPPIVVSNQSGNCWAPAITARTNVAIAWDTYAKGDYDVWFREFDASGMPRTTQPVANSADYEARPAITYGLDDSLWVAWEQSGPTWGKNWGGTRAATGHRAVSGPPNRFSRVARRQLDGAAAARRAGAAGSGHSRPRQQYACAGH